jgi:hypothetical protein
MPLCMAGFLPPITSAVKTKGRWRRGGEVPATAANPVREQRSYDAIILGSGFKAQVFLASPLHRHG